MCEALWQVFGMEIMVDILMKLKSTQTQWNLCQRSAHNTDRRSLAGTPSSDSNHHFLLYDALSQWPGSITQHRNCKPFLSFIDTQWLWGSFPLTGISSESPFLLPSPLLLTVPLLISRLECCYNLLTRLPDLSAFHFAQCHQSPLIRIKLTYYSVPHAMFLQRLPTENKTCACFKYQCQERMIRQVTGKVFTEQMNFTPPGSLRSL